MNIKHNLISSWNDARSTYHPKDVTIADWLEGTREPGKLIKYPEPVLLMLEHLHDRTKDGIFFPRSLGSEKSLPYKLWKKECTNIKLRLPCITPGGTFHRRDLDGFKEYSGGMQIDIDWKDNRHIPIDSLPDIRDRCGEIDCVIYSGISTSGFGIWLMIEIESPGLFEKHFNALYRRFKSMGVNIDKNVATIDRARFYNYDPDGIINYDSVPFTETAETREPPRPKKTKSEYNGSGENKKVVELVGAIVKKGIDITGRTEFKTGVENWFAIAYGFAREFGADGRGMFNQVSQFHNDYTEKEANNVYDRALSEMDFEVDEKATLGTFIHLCKEFEI